jgi:hypothetical protein
MFQDWWDDRRTKPIKMPTIRPALPIPTGEIPWWKRLMEALVLRVKSVRVQDS